MKDLIKSIGLFFLDFIEVIVTSLVIFVIFYLVLLQPHQVRGDSMLPNFADNEYLLTDKISYRFRQPQRGEVIIFKAPANEKFDYIKRIIALPGEKVKIVEGKIYINNLVLNESLYLPPDQQTSSGRFLSFNEVLIPDDQYFVLGDNRENSSDSREWGYVPKNNIVGKAWLSYWPVNKIGFIKPVNY